MVLVVSELDVLKRNLTSRKAHCSSPLGLSMPLRPSKSTTLVSLSRPAGASNLAEYIAAIARRKARMSLTRGDRIRHSSRRSQE